MQATRRAGRIALLALLATAVASLADARTDRRDRNTLSRRTAGGGEFPTWEREVESEERSPLPDGPPGRFSPTWTLELGGMPAGIAAIGADAFVVPLVDGRIRRLDVDGAELGVDDAGGRVGLPPLQAGALVLVAAGERLVGVSRDGVTWRSEPGGRIVHVPAVVGDLAFVAREGGTLEALRVADGSRAWSVALGGEAGTAPSASGRLVAVGVSGEIAGFVPSTGATLFRLPLGDRVDSVSVAETTLLASGLGASGRSRDVTPVMVGWMLRRDGMPTGRPWRLRVGGTCSSSVRWMDDLAVFTCADGYVRAIDRQKGVGGWKTDLPTASAAGPVVSGARLDYVIPQSRHAVALQADNGAVLGWVTLPDEDELFVGGAAGVGAITAATTSFGRVVGWRWEWLEDDDDSEDEPKRRPGEDDEDRRRGVAIPILR